MGVWGLELNTMPGWAGSSWYWMRYMDAHNENEFASQEALKYWESVDLYIGGSEHATGHLLYARFWNKFLKDKGFAPTEEPFKKLINQGMILGMSAIVYRFDENTSFGTVTKNDLPKIIVSGGFYNEFKKLIYLYNLSDSYDYGSKDKFELLLKENKVSIEEWEPHRRFIEFIRIEISKVGKNGFFEFDMETFTPIHVDISLINEITNELYIDKFKGYPLYNDYGNAVFIGDNGAVNMGEIGFRVSREAQF